MESTSIAVGFRDEVPTRAFYILNIALSVTLEHCDRFLLVCQLFKLFPRVRTELRLHRGVGILRGVVLRELG